MEKQIDEVDVIEIQVTLAQIQKDIEWIKNNMVK
jgi:hypothetical protein